MILYTLVVINSLTGLTMHIEYREMQFDECRFARLHEISRYKIYHDLDVHVICYPTQKTGDMKWLTNPYSMHSIKLST